MQKNLSTSAPMAELPQGAKVEALTAAAEKTAGSVRETTRQVINQKSPASEETMGLEEAVALLDWVKTKSEARWVMSDCMRRGLIQGKATQYGIIYTPADNPLVQKFVSLINTLPSKPRTAKRRDLPRSNAKPNERKAA